MVFKSLCYRPSAVISQISLSVTSEELSDRCLQCKSLPKAFCYFVLNPDVTYQPGLPGSSIIWANTQQHRRDIDRALLTLVDHLWGFPKFKVLDLTMYIYLQLWWLEQAPLVWLGKVWEGQREYCPFTAWSSLWGVQACRLTAGSVLTWPHIILLWQGMF